MSEVLNAMRTAWLALYRNGFPRDMRKYVFRMVAPTRFDWETAILIEQTMKRKKELSPQHRLRFKLELVTCVEQPPENWQQILDHHGHSLAMSRVSIKRKYFSGLQREWMWLYPD